MERRKSGKLIGLKCILLLGIMACVFAGCGKKGLPVAPRALPLPVVIDLTAVVKNDAVTLTWSTPRSGEEAAVQVAGFFVGRSKVLLADADCQDCPVFFERVADISLEFAGKEKSEKFELTHTDPVEKGYRYIYKVRAYTPVEVTGPDSNLVEFIH